MMPPVGEIKKKSCKNERKVFVPG